MDADVFRDVFGKFLKYVLEAIQSAPQEHIPQILMSLCVSGCHTNCGVLEVAPERRGTGCVAEQVVDVPAHKDYCTVRRARV